MNGKKAKALRKRAKQVQAELGLDKESQYGRNRKGTVTLQKGCERDVYQWLKAGKPGVEDK